MTELEQNQHIQLLQFMALMQNCKTETEMQELKEQYYNIPRYSFLQNYIPEKNSIQSFSSYKTHLIYDMDKYRQDYKFIYGENVPAYRKESMPQNKANYTVLNLLDEISGCDDIETYQKLLAENNNFPKAKIEALSSDSTGIYFSDEKNINGLPSDMIRNSPENNFNARKQLVDAGYSLFDLPSVDDVKENGIDWLHEEISYFKESLNPDFIDMENQMNQEPDFQENEYAEEFDNYIEEMYANDGMSSMVAEADYEAEQNPRPDYLENSSSENNSYGDEEYWKTQFLNDNAETFKALDDFLNNGIKPKNDEFIFSKVPEILKSANVSDNEIVIKTSVINKARNEHSLSADEIRKTVENIAVPVLIFDSDRNSTENKKDSYLSLTDTFAQNGKPVAFSMNLDSEYERKNRTIEVNEIRTIHDRTLVAKSGTDLIQKWTEDGLCRYVDDKKISEWSKAAGVQFPLAVLQSDGSRIQQNDGFVNEILSFSKFADEREEMEKEYQEWLAINSPDEESSRRIDSGEIFGDYEPEEKQPQMQERNVALEDGEEMDKGMEQIQANGGMDDAAAEADYEAEQNPEEDKTTELSSWYDTVDWEDPIEAAEAMHNGTDEQVDYVITRRTQVAETVNEAYIHSEEKNKNVVRAFDIWTEIKDLISEKSEYEAKKFAALDYLYNKGTDDAAGYENSFERNIPRLDVISKSDKHIEQIFEKYKDYKIDFDDQALAVKIAGTHNNNFNKAKQDFLDFIENKKYLRETELTQKQEVSLFDKELQEFIDGKLPKSHIFTLGKPSEILVKCGFPAEQRIELSASHLEFKSKLPRHTFNLLEIRGLEKAIQNPIAVFEYGDRTKSQNIIVNIEKDGKNFLTGVHFNQSTRGYEVSDIRTLYPKENVEWLNWINQGKLIYGDKEKLQALIAQQRMNVAEVSSQVAQSPLHEHCLESSSSILDKFGEVKDVFTDEYPFYEEVKKKAAIEHKFFSYYVTKGNLDARELSVLEGEEFYNAIKTGDVAKIDEYIKTDLHEINELAAEIYETYSVDRKDPIEAAEAMHNSTDEQVDYVIMRQKQEVENVNEAYIHSEDFISKFGDWEKASRLQKLSETSTIVKNGKVIIDGEDITDEVNKFRNDKDNKILRIFAKNIGRSVKGTYHNDDLNIDVELSIGNIDEIKNHHIVMSGHLEAIQYIPDIIKNGIYIAEEANEDKTKHPNIEKYKYFVSALNIDGVDYTCKSAVGVDKDGNHYYDQRLSQIEKGLLLDNLSQLMSRGKSEQSLLVYDKRLLRICQCPQALYLDKNLRPTKDAVKSVMNGKLYVEKDKNGFQLLHDLDKNKVIGKELSELIEKNILDISSTTTNSMKVEEAINNEIIDNDIPVENNETEPQNKPQNYENNNSDLSAPRPRNVKELHQFFINNPYVPGTPVPTIAIRNGQTGHSAFIEGYTFARFEDIGRPNPAFFKEENGKQIRIKPDGQTVVLTKPVYKEAVNEITGKKELVPDEEKRLFIRISRDLYEQAISNSQIIAKRSPSTEQEKQKMYDDYLEAANLDEKRQRADTADNFWHNYQAGVMTLANNKQEAMAFAKRLVNEMIPVEREKFAAMVRKYEKLKGPNGKHLSYDQRILERYEDITKGLKITNNSIWRDHVGKEYDTLDAIKQNTEVFDKEGQPLDKTCRMKIGDTIKISVTADSALSNKKIKLPPQEYRLVAHSKDSNSVALISADGKQKIIKNREDFIKEVQKVEKRQIKKQQRQDKYESISM